MRLLHDGIQLIRVRLRQVRNTLACLRLGHYIKGALLLGLGALFIAAEFWFFLRIFGGLRDQEVLSPFFVQGLLERLLGMVFLSALSMLLFSSIVSSISSLFLSADIPLLLSSPIATLPVFFVKHLEATVNSAYMVVTFTLPILAAYGWCFHAGPLYYAVAVVVLVVFVIPPCAAGVGVTLVLARYLPAKRTQQVLLLGGLMAAVTLITLLRLLRPEQLLNPEATDDLKRLLEGLTFPALDFMPSTWATRTLLHTLTGDRASALRYFSLLAGLGLLLVGALYAAAVRAYPAALSRSMESGGAGKRRRRFRPGMKAPLALRLFPASARSVIEKDVRSFVRDTSQWSQLFLLGALVVIYLFNIKLLPREQLFLTPHLSLADFISWLNMGLAGVVLSAVALRFVYPSMSLEGRSIWILKSSPVRFRPILWTRFILHGIPMLLLAEALTVASNLLLRADLFIHVLSFVMVIVMTVTLTAMAAGLGASKPYFKSLNQAQIAVSSGGMLFMVLSMVYVGLMMAACFRPVQVHFFERWTGEAIEDSRVLWCYLAVVIASAAGTLVPMALGAREMERTDT